jgi:RimJ/RimL family protein N-acetyltransferase
MKNLYDQKWRNDLRNPLDKITLDKLTEWDIPDVVRLCDSNPQYYQHCPPAASPESITSDMLALPDGKSRADKYYLGFWKRNKLAAVLDLILKYPDDKTAFIGFFMIDASLQGKGIGSAIVKDICFWLKSQFDFIRLGYVRENIQAEKFWCKNEFKPTGETIQTDQGAIVLMQRDIRTVEHSH